MIHLERTSQVWAITGNLGGGKTLSAVALAVDSMSRGYYVVSNITLNLDKIRLLYGDKVAKLYHHIDLDDPSFDPFKLPCGSPRGSGGNKRVLVIIDECAEWVDQYSSAQNPKIASFWSWLRHSSKRSQDVLLVVQRMDYLNKVIRLLISRWVIVDDLAVWRIPYLKMRLPFCRSFVMQRVFDRTGHPLYSPTYCSKETWGLFYNTAECLNSQGSSYVSEYDTNVHKCDFPFFWFLIYLSTFVAVCYYIIKSQDAQDADMPAPVVGVSASCSLGYMCPYPHTEFVFYGSSLPKWLSRFKPEVEFVYSKET